MMFSRSTVLKTVMAALAFLVTGQARAGFVSLPSNMETLTTAGNYTSVGNYTFTFSNYNASTVGGVTVPAGSATVDAITGALTGFEVTAPFVAQAGSQNDVSFSYAVSTRGAGITSISLNANGDIAGGGIAYVLETVYTDASEKTILGQLKVTTGTVTLELLNGQAADGGYMSLYVTKDIVYNTYNAGDAAGFSIITQTFAVPEPASAAMLGIGLTALGLVSRRRSRRGHSAL